MRAKASGCSSGSVAGSGSAPAMSVSKRYSKSIAASELEVDEGGDALGPDRLDHQHHHADRHPEGRGGREAEDPAQPLERAARQEVHEQAEADHADEERGGGGGRGVPVRLAFVVGLGGGVGFGVVLVLVLV